MWQQIKENRVLLLLLGIILTVVGIGLIGKASELGIVPSWEWEAIVAMFPAILGFIFVIVGMRLVLDYFRF